MTSVDGTDTDGQRDATRRTVLYLIVTAASFLVAVLLDREVFYRGYGDGGYGTGEFGE